MNKIKIKPRLKQDYQLSNYCPTEGNNFAVLAAKTVISERGKTNFNPLFLFGPTGCGKTHLLHAIGNEILKNSPDTWLITDSSSAARITSATANPPPLVTKEGKIAKSTLQGNYKSEKSFLKICMIHFFVVLLYPHLNELCQTTRDVILSRLQASYSSALVFAVFPLTIFVVN